jgi:hypothetical protein
MQRAGSQIVHRVEKAIALPVQRHAVTCEADFVWINSARPVPVRSRAPGGQSSSSDQITPYEIVEAAKDQLVAAGDLRLGSRGIHLADV